ncbi:MFS general substrate transporter [Gautieria morchelliformis]|nr:MFS general substrate transporter [Gautieria morchelliformis]
MATATSEKAAPVDVAPGPDPISKAEDVSDHASETYTPDVDLSLLHEARAGRLVVDPEEAKVEFGSKLASRLKLNRAGTKVLWPQPDDSNLDPQNWPTFKKNYLLIIITLAAITPDFNSGIGIASIFALAQQFSTTTAVINNQTSNWSIFLLGWGGILAVMLMRRYGRLPVLFWTQLLSVGFLVGCTFAPDLATFTAMRCLTAFFGTCPQVTGLYVVTDLFPFHLQARKLNMWTFGFIISPFLSPFAFGFLVARTTWRWAYGIGSIYSGLVLLLIVLFMEETMYDRPPLPSPSGPSPAPFTFAHRAKTLLGVTGMRLSKYRVSVWAAGGEMLNVVWRPHLATALIFEGVLFGFSIGINVTFAVFLGLPKEIGGYGFGPDSISACYATPIVSVIIGELIGRYGNDLIANWCIRRNHGVFEAEMRLWMCYLGLPLYITGFVVIGAAFQNHLTIGALIMGWGIAECAVMITTVAIYAYANDCFPKHQGEISALINLARTLGGFAVAYFQVNWATRNGALQTFGCEAAIVAGLFCLVVPVLQWKGREIRDKFSI